MFKIVWFYITCIFTYPNYNIAPWLYVAVLVALQSAKKSLLSFEFCVLNFLVQLNHVSLCPRILWENITFSFRRRGTSEFVLMEHCSQITEGKTNRQTWRCTINPLTFTWPQIICIHLICIHLTNSTAVVKIQCMVHSWLY